MALASVGGVDSGSSSNANVAKIAMEMRKKKTDVVEPQVINNELLVRGVEEPLRPDGRDTDPIDFPKVTSLRLSFLNIIEVANLNNFNSLTTLRLDNNIIDRIANLDALPGLTWLDLSFNNLQHIEGLDQLTKLTDLSLYHNHIEEIKGLDGCINLNILSLGHNSIKDLKQIDNLRKFQNLRCVCLDGNEVCKADSYKQHVLAYLTNLKYLDYMLIDKKDVAQAQEGYQLDELTELREREAADTSKEKAIKDKHTVLEKLKLSFQDCTEDLFEELFSQGTETKDSKEKENRVEPEQVTVLSCYNALKEEFREKLNEDNKNLRVTLDLWNDKKNKQVNAFVKALEQAEQDSEDEAFHMIRLFRSTKKKVLAQLEMELNPDQGPTPEEQQIIKKLIDDLKDLENHLLANEIQLQESLEEAMGEFEAEVERIIKTMAEKGTDFFRRLEEHAKGFHQSLLEGVNSEVESFQANQDNLQDVDPDKAKFLGSREEMNAACTQFGESHSNLITAKDDYMQNQMQKWQRDFFDGHRNRQYTRNRQRITDIKKIVGDCDEEIRAADPSADDYGDSDRYPGDQFGGR